MKNGPNQRECDLPELLPGVDAVDGGGLVDFVVDGLQAGEVDEYRVGDALPDGEEDDWNPAELLIGQQRGGQPLDAQRLAELGQRVHEDVLEHVADDQHGRGCRG